MHVGNFVEIKNSRDRRAARKANHLTYVGDATVGARVNIGAGTITCNYDGANKHRTVIEDDAFIGSDTAAGGAGHGRARRDDRRGHHHHRGRARRAQLTLARDARRRSAAGSGR